MAPATRGPTERPPVCRLFAAGVKQVDVDLTWEPQWGMDMMSDEARLELGFM